MTKILLATAIAASALLAAGCASQYKKDEQNMKQAQSMPVSCPNAEADISMLQSELATTKQKAAAGVTAVIPLSAVVGIVEGTEGTKAEIATGEYNQILEQKIAEIKNTCGIQ
jgi:outer membrane murein-binding lipoprotein Lpp